MILDRRSRYYGLPVVAHEGRIAPVQRLVPRLGSDEQVLLHRLSETETLDQLARRYYGREDLWWRIADANPGKFPLDWQPGDVVRIPTSRKVTRLP